ncbi:hypothetical protein [Hymenobacter sp. HDW8]|uniref:hypothetical protein n=1 Tax=Hymenobacter sp. HDW8 TaxID=2714932 RepID=UPI00140E167E|nr:hypothetical protein [Hymenobacter sp. HDW8]QIL78348.1 hypothetical protein G7064_21265 [Hymenobacter sp. HDW8]
MASLPSLLPAQRQALGLALRLARLPHLALEPYERLLLEGFERGELTLDQVLTHVEASAFAPERRVLPAWA